MHASKLAKTSMLSTKSLSETQAAVSPLVNDLFTKFKVMYGPKFKSLFHAPNADASERLASMMMMEWDEKLHGIKPELVGYGLKRLSAEIEQAKNAGKEAWPPSADQFAALCKPRAVDVGMPNVNAAYTAAKLRSWNLHPAVEVAAIRISAEDWNKGDHYCIPKFRKIYQELVEQIAAGGALPESSAIAALPDYSAPSAEEIKHNCDAMRAALKGKK